VLGARRFPLTTNLPIPTPIPAPEPLLIARHQLPHLIERIGRRLLPEQYASGGLGQLVLKAKYNESPVGITYRVSMPTSQGKRKTIATLSAPFRAAYRHCAAVSSRRLSARRSNRRSASPTVMVRGGKTKERLRFVHHPS
jgi:hypothetical protein